VALFYVGSGFSLKAATGLSQVPAAAARCPGCRAGGGERGRRRHGGAGGRGAPNRTAAPQNAPPPLPPRAQAAIAGGSFVSMLFNLMMRHPWDPGRPLVDLDLALVLTPALLLGVSIGAASALGPRPRRRRRAAATHHRAASVAAAASLCQPVAPPPPTHLPPDPPPPPRPPGVLLNDLLPVWGVLALLVALLAFSCKSVLLRGLNEWAEEQQKVAAAHAAAAIRSGPVPRLAPISIAHVPSTLCPARLQVVISREPSRAQMADSSDDEEGARRSGRGAAALGGAGGGGSGVWGGVGAASPPPGDAGAQQQAGAPGDGSALGIGRTASLKTPLATVPSGDSDQVGSDGLEEPGKLLEDAFSRALEEEEEEQRREAVAAAEQQQQQQQQWAGGRGGGGGGGDAPPKQVEWRDIADAAAAAAAAAAPHANGGHAGGAPGSPSWAASSPRLALRFPWIKLVSLALLWLGFLGLSALDALLPLCSATYVAYLLLFMAITLGVTAMVRRGRRAWGRGRGRGRGRGGAGGMVLQDHAVARARTCASIAAASAAATPRLPTSCHAPPPSPAVHPGHFPGAGAPLVDAPQRAPHQAQAVADAGAGRGRRQRGRQRRRQHSGWQQQRARPAAAAAGGQQRRRQQRFCADA
jgi:hypothetical protein